MNPVIMNNKEVRYYTPEWAIMPLLQIIPREWHIYEPCRGNGDIENFFKKNGYNASGSDIEEGKDFLAPLFSLPDFDCIVTNPPYNLKTEFLQRCIELEKPFALLMPTSTFHTEARFKMLAEYDIKIISFLGKRISFLKAGEREENGKRRTVKKDSPPSETYWFCRNIPGLKRTFNYYEGGLVK